MGVKIILNAIVRDELKAGVLFRGLENCKHIFNYVAILDTGSTDDSVEALRNWMKENKKDGLIGTSQWERDFEGFFSRARTAAIKLAYDVMKKVDPEGNHTFYAMFHDADNEIWSNEQTIVPLDDMQRKTGILMPWSKAVTKSLKGGKINVNMKTGYSSYKYAWMVNLGTSKKINNWEWICSVHEYVDDMGSGLARDQQEITTGYIHSGRDGARGKKVITKYWKDAETLERELKDPTSKAPKSRLIYYLANSYKDLRWWEKAAENYAIRIYMGDFGEEIFHSYIGFSDMMSLMGKKESIVLKPLFEAMVLFPNRLEAVYKVVLHYLNQKRYHEAWNAGKTYLNTPYPERDLLFVDEDLYRYNFSLTMLNACYWSGLFYNNTRFLEGKFENKEEDKNVMTAQIHADVYKKILQGLLKNDYIKDKKTLIPYVRDTYGIWNEVEKSVYYSILDPEHHKPKKPNPNNDLPNNNTKQLDSQGPVGILI